MDAFSKSYQGWLAPTPVVGAVNGAPLPSSATSPTAYRLRGEPRRRGLEVRGAQGRGRVLPGREPAARRLGRRPPGLRRDRLPRRRGRHVQQQGQRRREPPAGRRRRGRRQPGHEHLRLPRLGRGRVPRLQRPRRLHRRDEPGGDALLRPVVGCGDARQRRLRRPDERQPLHPAAERLVRDGHRPHRHRAARSPAATTARPRRPASRPSRPTPEGRRSGAGSGRRPPARCGSRPRARPSTPCSGSTAARRSPRSRRSRATTTSDPTTGWSLLEAKVKRGVTYRIAVDGQNIGAGPGQGAGNARLPLLRRPTTGSRRRPSCQGKKGKKVSSNAGAGRQRKEPRKIAGKKAGQSVWYVYKAKRAGRLTIDLSGSKFNTVLGVYTGKKITKLHKVAAERQRRQGQEQPAVVPRREGHRSTAILVAGVKNGRGQVHGSAGTSSGRGRSTARRDARRNVVSTAGPRTAMATAVVIARPVSKLPVEVSRV